MLTLILVGLAVVIAVLLALAASRPSAFCVVRSADMQADPARIFGLLDDFRAWIAWSPWERLDPALQRTHGGAARGFGATYAWQGNKKVGSGRMEIVESEPPHRLVIKLDFIAPFEAHNVTTFSLTPAGGATRVTWTMDGTHNFMSKLFTLFMDMDKMVGKDFESGLANLKAQVEQAP